MIRSANLCRASLLVAVAFTLAAPAWANRTADAVVSYIQTPPIPELTGKLLEVARAVKPGQETELTAMMVLAPLGYPAFPGLSRDETPTWFFLEAADEEEPDQVILLKLAEDAPLRQSLTAMEIATKDIAGWTLVAFDPESLDRVTEVESLVALSRKPKTHDIQLTVPMDAEKSAAAIDEIVAEIEADLAGDDERPLSTAEVRELADFVAARVANVENFGAGANLSAASIDLVLDANVVADTPEAALVNAPHGGEVPLASQIPAFGAIHVLGRFDLGAINTYLAGLIEGVRPVLESEQAELIDEYLSLLEDYAAQMDGTQAASLTVQGQQVQLLAVNGGGTTYEEAFATLEAFNETAFQALIDVLPLPTQMRENLNQMMTVEEEADAIEGIPAFRMTVDASVMIPEEAAAASPEVQPATYWYAVKDGHLLSANDPAGIKQLAAIFDGQALDEPSVAEVLGPLDGSVMRYQVDIPAYLAGLRMGMENQVPPEALEIFDALEQSSMDPLSGVVSLGSNRAATSLSIPVSVIAEMVEIAEAAGGME